MKILRLLAVPVVAAAASAQFTQFASSSANGTQGDGPSYATGITPDGRFIAFYSDATNLVANDLNGKRDVFLKDRVNGTVERIDVSSSGAESDGDAVLPIFARLPIGISPDGRFIAFSSVASNLGAPDVNQTVDAFVRDRTLGLTECVSITPAGFPGAQGGMTTSISANGRWVGFWSSSKDLIVGKTTIFDDVYVRDRQLATTTRVSVGFGGVEGDAKSRYAAISDDGRFVAFESYASNLVAMDTNGQSDVFLHDRQLATTVRVNVSTLGAETKLSPTYLGKFSADARMFCFVSRSWTELTDGSVPSQGLVNGIFVRDLGTGVTTLVSTSTSGTPADSSCDWPCLSPDGGSVAFVTSATNLGPNSRVAVKDLGTGVVTGVVFTPIGGLSSPAHSPSVSDQGKFVAYASDGKNIVTPDLNAARDVFVTQAKCGATLYCTAKINSQGCTPLLASSGMPTLAGSTFHVLGSNLINKKSATLFWSAAPKATPFQDGWLCLAAPFERTTVLGTGGNPPPSDCSGTFDFHWTSARMQAHQLQVGQSIYNQVWSRDPGSPSTTSLTAGLAFTICP
jgi:Tol biopolymer transport system component